MFLIPLRELDLLGVYVTPASVLLVVCLIPSVILRYFFARIDLNRYVWNRPLVEVAMYVIFFSAAILTLRRG
jgi:hypothetical protein